MAKPSITKRITKSAALTYSELDTNFQNLADATLTLRAGTGGTNVTADLNGTITLVAGTNVTLTGDNSAKTITVNASSGSQNLFSTIAVAGQSNVVADSTSDTLTLVAGSNVTLTTNATTDTVTIAATSSGITDIIQDITPQLGGNLDVNGNSLLNNASGQGFINILEDYLYVGASSAGNITSGSNTRDFYIRTGESSDSSSYIRIQNSNSGNNNIEFLCHSAGVVNFLSVIKMVNYTTTQRNALTASDGMMIYNTTDNKFQGRAGGAWVDLH
jgi:hypothetical protein